MKKGAELIEPVQNQIINDNVTLEDNVVWFSSMEYYSNFLENSDTDAKQSFIAELDNNKNYVSLKKVFLSKGKINSSGRSLSSEEEEVADSNDFLSTMLNEDGLIGIGDYLFR